MKWMGERGGGGEWMGNERTFADFDSLDGLVVHGSGALLDEPVTFDAEVEYLVPLNR